MLRREVAPDSEIINSAQQKLELAICCPRSVLWNFCKENRLSKTIVAIVLGPRLIDLRFTDISRKKDSLTMSSKINSDPSQSAFRMRFPHDSATRNKAHRSGWNRLSRCLLDHKANARVIWHEEVIAFQRTFRKSLLSVPGHVVQGHERAVRQQQIVK